MTITLNAFASDISSRHPIGLGELQSTANFLIRKDRKYVIPARSLSTILSHVDAEARVLDIAGRRSFRYESLYFDTEDLRSYFGALRQRPDRFKVRVRAYKDSGLTYLEAKTRDHHGRTIKQRIDRYGCEVPMLYDPEQEWLGHLEEIGDAAPHLTHQITTRYTRITLVLPQGEGRVTIDHNLEFSTPAGRSVSISPVVILESKGAGHPTSFDHLLWRHGIRPVSISKYGCGLSLLSNELPSNRWHRVLNQLADAAVG